MTRHVRVYRMLIVLYPRPFRNEYASDLVQAFTDLARQRGVVSTWARTCIDLAVTIPRYHMELLMHRPASSSTLTAVAFVVGLAGFAGLALGPVVALPLLAGAAVLVLSQRTALAQSLVVPPDQRRARLWVACVLAVVFVAAIGSWVYHLNRYDELGNTTPLLHNLVGLLSLLGTLAFGLAALLTRKQAATT